MSGSEYLRWTGKPLVHAYSATDLALLSASIVTSTTYNRAQRNCPTKLVRLLAAYRVESMPM